MMKQLQAKPEHLAGDLRATFKTNLKVIDDDKIF